MKKEQKELLETLQSDVDLLHILVSALESELSPDDRLVRVSANLAINAQDHLDALEKEIEKQ